MFQQYLQSEFPELFAKTVQHGISLREYEALFSANKHIAVKALQEIIKTYEPAPPVKLNHVDSFSERYKDHLVPALEFYHKLIKDKKEYYDETGIRIVIDFDDLEEPIKVGRAPKGSRMRRPRELSIVYDFIQELIDNGWSTSHAMRVFPSDSDPYESAELLPDGTIKELSTGQVYKYPKHYTTKVYKDAVQRGTRNTVVGSPFKGIKMQDRRGVWKTLDMIWRDAIDWYNSKGLDEYLEDGEEIE